MDIESKLDYMKSVALANAKQRSIQQNLDKIEKNADDLDSVLNLRVNSALKQEFSRICKLNQSSASSELKRYMLKIVKQGSLYFKRPIVEFAPPIGLTTTIYTGDHHGCCRYYYLGTFRQTSFIHSFF